MADLKEQVLKNILAASVYYDKELNNKNCLILTKVKQEVVSYEMVFSDSNFKHFTGVESNLSSSKFFLAAISKKLSINDFTITENYLVSKKMNILENAVRLPKTAKMVGEFENVKIRLKADLGGGTTNYVMAFRKDINNDSVYVPVSVMEDDVRQVTNPTSPIIAIFRKDKSAALYDEMTYKSKNINIDKLHIPKEIKSKLSPKALRELQPTEPQEEQKKPSDKKSLLGRLSEKKELLKSASAESAVTLESKNNEKGKSDKSNR